MYQPRHKWSHNAELRQSIICINWGTSGAIMQSLGNQLYVSTEAQVEPLCRVEEIDYMYQLRHKWTHNAEFKQSIICINWGTSGAIMQSWGDRLCGYMSTIDYMHQLSHKWSHNAELRQSIICINNRLYVYVSTEA